MKTFAPISVGIEKEPNSLLKEKPMKEIKIILVEDVLRSDNYGDDHWNEYVLRQGITDWETISDEDFYWLKQNLNKLKNYNDVAFRNFTYRLIVKNEMPVFTAIQDIKDEIAKQEEETRKRAEAFKKVDEERKRKAAEKKMLKNMTLDQIEAQFKEKYGITE